MSGAWNALLGQLESATNGGGDLAEESFGDVCGE